MENNLSYGEDHKYIPATSIESGKGIEILPDIYSHTVQIVNIVLVGHPDSNDFVLVDAGMPYSAKKIIAVIEERFGPKSRPNAIILTHGHFDHIGAIIELIEHWQVPVYAHELELPFLRGKRGYPKPDSTVEGGLIAKISPVFPIEPIYLGDHVAPLPKDGSVPYLHEFQWIHTPGHSPGHISLFRDKDKLIIAGDAFVTVKQEYLYKVLTQKQEISGPPRYLTTDWTAAFESVKILEALKPTIAITGHGLPMTGLLLTESLGRLVQDFNRIAVPDYGVYVEKPPQ